MQTRQTTERSFLWALLALVLLKVLVDGIKGWSDIAILVSELR